MKTLLTGTVAAMFFAGAAYAQDVLVVVDGETMTMDQYRSTLAEPRDDFWFDAWDRDRDAVLTRDEFLEGSFATFDIDDDEMLSQEEVKAWNEENLRYNAMRSGRMISSPEQGGGDAGTATDQ